MVAARADPGRPELRDEMPFVIAAQPGRLWFGRHQAPSPDEEIEMGDKTPKRPPKPKKPKAPTA
jgi:hypothetical protein